MTLDEVIRELLRQLVREEICPALREELKVVTAELTRRRSAEGAPVGDYLTVEEVAAMLKVTEPTVREWIKTGALRAMRPSAGDKPGRVYRIYRADLDAFVLAANGAAPEANVDVKAEAARIIALATKRPKF